MKQSLGSGFQRKTGTASDDLAEKSVQSEMTENHPAEFRRLVADKPQLPAVFGQHPDSVRDSGIQSRFHDRMFGIMPAHHANRLLQIRIRPRKRAINQFAHAVSHIGNNGLQRQRWQIEITSRGVHRIRNILARINQGSVEIEDHTPVLHALLLRNGTSVI